MDSKLGRYLLFVVSVALIAIGVDHFQGRWINNQLTNAIASTLSFFKRKGTQYSTKLIELSNEPKQTELKINHPLSSSETNNAVPQLSSQQGDNTRSNNEYEVHSFSCSKAALTEKQIADRKKKQEERLIFSWVDDDGVTHFSDTLFGNEENTKVLDFYGIELAPFEMTVTTNRTLPKYFERDTSVGVKKIYQIISRYMAKELIRPVQLNLVFSHSKREYDALQSSKAPTATASQGFYSGKHNLAAVWYKNEQQARRTAIHEAVHVINSGLFGNTPRWLNEGLAEYFETIKVSGLAGKITPLNWQQKYAVHRMPLGTIIYGNNNSWKKKSRQNMYIASHSFVYFLMSTPNGKQLIKKIFKHLAENRCQQHDLQPIFATYPAGFYGLEKDWHDWMRKGKYRTQAF